MESRFGIEIEVLERALKNMIDEGYMNVGATIEDLESYTYSMCEGKGWYAKSKIYDWASN
jgi:hypothetical protein